MHTPDLTSLELDITYACGFGCHNCNRVTVLAPGQRRQNVTVAQIDRMLAASIACNHVWKRITLLGGEPTVHPEFRRIVNALAVYRAQHNRHLVLRVVTHGAGDHARRQIAWVESTYPFVEILNTHKTSVVQAGFQAFNVAPQDLDPEWSRQHRYEGCAIVHTCGIGFNYAGFYCCALAAGIDRIFGLDLAVRRVDELTRERLTAMYDTFCSKCGHYRPLVDNSTTLVSPTWRKALEAYETGDVQLSRY